MSITSYAAPAIRLAVQNKQRTESIVHGEVCNLVRRRILLFLHLDIRDAGTKMG